MTDEQRTQVQAVADAFKTMQASVRDARLGYRDEAKKLKAARDEAIEQAYADFAAATGTTAPADPAASPSEPRPRSRTADAS
jgi:hypothetical protein